MGVYAPCVNIYSLDFFTEYSVLYINFLVNSITVVLSTCAYLSHYVYIVHVHLPPYFTSICPSSIRKYCLLYTALLTAWRLNSTTLKDDVFVFFVISATVVPMQVQSSACIHAWPRRACPNCQLCLKRMLYCILVVTRSRTG